MAAYKFTKKCGRSQHFKKKPRVTAELFSLDYTLLQIVLCLNLAFTKAENSINTWNFVKYPPGPR